MKGTALVKKAIQAAKKYLTHPHVVALATAGITQVVAYVPQWAPQKQLMISVAGVVIGGAYTIADAIRSGKVTPESLAKDAAGFVQAELGKVDFNTLARDALSGNASELVQTELRKVLASVVAPAPAPAAAQVAAPAAPSPQVAS